MTYRFIQLSYFYLPSLLRTFDSNKQETFAVTKTSDDDILRNEIKYIHQEKSETRKVKEAAPTANLGNETSVTYKCHSIFEACHQK